MVLLIRSLHGAISVFFLSCLAFVYYAAITRRRDRRLAGAAIALVAEGTIVYANGGDCPLGPVHQRVGDDRTFFELFVPPNVARHAVPFFAGVAVLGFVLVLLRPPRSGLDRA